MQKKLLMLAKIAVSAVLITWVITGIDVQDVWAKFTEARVSWLAIAALFFLTMLILGATRWQIVLRGLGEELPVATTSRLFLVGMFFNQTMPSSIGGDATRVFYLWRNGTNAKTAFNSVLLDRISGLIILVLVTSIIAPTLLGRLTSPIAVNGVILVVAFSWAAIIALFVFDNAFARRFQKFRLFNLAIGLSRDSVRLARDIVIAGPLMLVSLAIHGTTIAIAWSLDHALGGEADILIYVIALTPTILIISIPVSIAGWGVREQILVIFLGALGVGSTQAVSVSILFGVLLLVGCIPGGLLWLGMRAPRKVTPSDGID
ncbi:MAG: hypothetical protein CL573_05395 [Alphaproteobacteria bacterium]|nr:hypothetical protein [Alphaproteobacteria bacterium]HCP01473.1 hypothetical protein [Rhodospirillaceae bacterium]